MSRLPEISLDDLLHGRVRGMCVLQHANVLDVDLSHVSYPSLRLMFCSFKNCRFDGAQLRDLRVWASSFHHCSFRGAHLREFSFGGELDGRFNSFHDCDFTDADLRGAGPGAAVMIRCTFDKTNLRKVEFSGTQLTQCVFRGLLREVIFHAHCFNSPHAPPNRMVAVDLSQAQLRWCDFRELDLDTVIPPSQKDHVIVRELSGFLRLALPRYERLAPSPEVAAVLGHVAKWKGPNQRIAIFHRKDLAEMLDHEELAVFESMASMTT